jgi:hypothetical protein
MCARRFPTAFVVAVTGFALLAACSNSLLAPANVANVIDTVTLYALSGTPLFTPSAYAINGRTPVRTDLSITFDFAFNFDSLSRPVLLPSGALGLPKPVIQPGFAATGASFAALTIAPTEGYEVDRPLVVDTGTVVLARSQNLTCPDGTIQSLYAKLHVLDVDTAATARTIRFEILTDQNCAYRGLAPGIPGQ